MQILNIDEISWKSANQSLREQLGLSDFSGSVFAFQSIYQGLFEITLSLSQLYSHKTELLMPLECGPYWTKLAADSTRIALRSHVMPSSEISGKIGNKVQAKSLLAAFSSVDDPWLAHFYNHQWMTPLLTEKVFCIRVVHHKTFDAVACKGLSPFEGVLWALNKNLCVAVLGERVKAIPFSVPYSNWDRANVLGEQATAVPSSSVSSEAFKAAVVQFESDMCQLGGAPLVKSDQRVWDRAIVTWSNVDGSAIRDVLIAEHQINPESVETLSACRWPLFQNFDWLMAQGFSPEQIRGSLVVSKELVNNEKFIKALGASLSRILALQG